MTYQQPFLVYHICHGKPLYQIPNSDLHRTRVSATILVALSLRFKEEIQG